MIAEYCLENQEKIVKEASYFSFLIFCHDLCHILNPSLLFVQQEYDSNPMQIYSNLPNKNRLYLSRRVFFLAHLLQI